MPRLIVLDEIYLTFRIKPELKEAATRKILRILASKPFMARLQTTIRQTVAAQSAMKEVQVTLSR
ncbi:MAG TPA: hypothetical protein VGI99_00255 [Gemmataceae bacterium]